MSSGHNQMTDHPTQATVKPVQRSLLLPLLIVLVLLVAGFSLALQVHHRQHLERATLERGQVFSQLLQRLIEERSTALVDTLHGITRNDPHLVDHLVNGDREELLEHYTPQFLALRDGLDVAHFYFHTAYGHNLLRLHRPDRYGDRIDRHTMNAVLGGQQVSVGIELGPLGIMALRAIERVETPDGRLVGFVELGVDLHSLLEVLNRDHGADFVVITHKEELDREGWEISMELSDSSATWEQFQNVVVSYESQPGLAVQLANIIEADPGVREDSANQRMNYLTLNERQIMALTYPLRDLTGAQRGDVIALRDVTDATAEMQQVGRTVSLAAGMLSAALVCFLYVALRRVDRGIQSQQADLLRSRERLDFAMSVANDGVWDWNVLTNEVSFDDRYFTMVGYEVGAFPGTFDAWKSRVHPEDFPRVHAAMSSFLGDETDTFDSEFRFLCADGEYRWLRGRGKIVARGADGKPTRFVGTHSHISKRKQAEAEKEHAAATLSKRNRTLESLNRLGGDLTLATSIEEIGKRTVSVLREQDGAPLIGIYLVDDTGNYLELTYYDAIRVDDALLSSARRLPIASSFNGLALQQGDIIHCADFANDERIHPEVQAAFVKAGARAETILPLIFRGRPMGTIAIVYPEPVEYGEEERWAHNAVAQTVAIAIENLHNLEELGFQARHDSLTGLPNRLALHEYFEHLVQPGHDDLSVVLLLLDLNRFKEVNDTLGHHIGDELLCALSHRLRPNVHKLGGQLYRLGGDEFAVVLLQPASEAAAIATSIGEELRRPVAIRGLNLELDSSIGVAIYPEHGTDSHELLRCADIAMYQAKAGIWAFRIYQEDDDDKSPQRLEMLSKFRAALENDQLDLYFQPRIMLEDQNTLSCEALLRWEIEDQQFMGPDEFIPLVETTDLIHPLTLWVLRRALEQANEWSRRGLNLTVSVNVSGRNLIDVEFPAKVMALMKEVGATGKQLQIEITETVLVADPERALHVLRALSGLGISIAIDDFGTGYSSLSYLKKLPLNALKVDASFVQDMLRREQDAVIVQSTISLAHSLGLRVVAEGVEELEVVRRLQEMECDEAQGYYFSEPLPASSFEDWASNKRSA